MQIRIVGSDLHTIRTRFNSSSAKRPESGEGFPAGRPVDDIDYVDDIDDPRTEGPRRKRVGGRGTTWRPVDLATWFESTGRQVGKTPEGPAREPRSGLRELRGLRVQKTGGRLAPPAGETGPGPRRDLTRIKGQGLRREG